MSDRRARPETTGCFPAAATARRHAMNDPTARQAARQGPCSLAVDWASADHAVCVVDAAGTVLWRHTVSHSRAGLARLTAPPAPRSVAPGRHRARPTVRWSRRCWTPACAVAVVPPRQVKNLRLALSARRARTTASTPIVLADTMRTDGHRLHRPDPRHRADDRAAGAGPRPTGPGRGPRRTGQPAASTLLELAFPARSGCSSTCTALIARAFLRRFPTAARGRDPRRRRHGRLAGRRGLLRPHPGRGLHRTGCAPPRPG